MNRLPHGYTNESELSDEGSVVKRYIGRGAEERARTEAHCLRALCQLLPVPKVVSSDVASLTISYVEGTHGQDLIGEGQAEEVFFAAGRMLRRIHEIGLKLTLAGEGDTLVHGDFGPQNLLFSDDARHVVAVLDWEWAHYGSAVEDLAWAEWIVRMHHPNDVGALPALFDAYGFRPAWHQRKQSMIDRCVQLQSFDPVQRGGSTGHALWQQRSSITRAWDALPDDPVNT
jgi:aminoglycoside phosphotransferase